MADDGIAFDGKAKDELALGGAETAFAELAEALAGRGHRVAAYSRCREPLEWKGVRWTPLEFGLPRAADLYIANRSWRLIEACAGARRALFWIHNPARYLRKLRYQWRLLKRRPAIVFSGASHLATYPRWGMGGARAVIPYGVTSAFLDAPERSRPPAPRAVFTSNPLRSLDWLLDIWAGDIFPRVAGAELHIFAGAQVYGEAGARKSIEIEPVLERARSLGPSGVVLRQPLGKAALARELLGARAFLYRGDIGETFCNSAAEAQAMGVPAAVEDIACMRERVRDGETGFVVQGRDSFARAARRLLADDALWLEMHRKSLALQRSWTWTKAAQAFEALA